MNNYLYIFLLFILIVNSLSSNDNDFFDLKNHNSSICDLKISTDNLVIFEKCVLSDEWKLFYEKTTSQNVLEVYENKETKRRVFNFDYIDSQKQQQDIIIENITVQVYDHKDFIHNINISILNDNFPIYLKRGDNFDVIVEYENFDLLYVNLVFSVYFKNNINSKIIDLSFGYKKIISNEFIKKIDLSYFFLVIFFIIFIFLLRLKFLITDNKFIKIHIDEIMQGKNAETIFVVLGIILTILLFFMIIKYIYYITFIFSILLAILSVKSFFKYLFKVRFPSFTILLDDKFILIKQHKVEYSNIVFYPMSILVIIFWYYISDENNSYLHTFLNDIIFFTIVYFNVHKLNIKNFYIIASISFFVILYQIVKIILDENAFQKDKNNIYYITTRFIIDVPIRFILKDFVDSPFEEIYFFSILDIILIGFVIHYCENTYHLSRIYLRISIYGSIIGIIINMIIFYGMKFSPPMSTIPLFICIISLIGYSISKKQFSDFMDIEQKKEIEELKEIEEIQGLQENQNAQIEFLKTSDKFNISFNNDQIFEENKDNFKIKELDKEENEEEDSDEEEKKKHENIINQFNRKISLANINSNSNKINRMSLDQQDDSDNEGLEKFIELVRGISEKKIESPFFSPDTWRIKEMKNQNINNKKEETKIEMKVFDENKENKENPNEKNDLEKKND